MKKFRAGNVGGEAPSSPQVQAMLECVWVGFVCRNNQRQARRVKKELGEEVRLLKGVLMDNREELGPADHKV